MQKFINYTILRKKDNSFLPKRYPLESFGG